jgi:hypothetical protein
MQHILGRGQTSNGKGKEEPCRQWNFQAQWKDLNTMDVDVIATTINAMTAKEREKFL